METERDGASGSQPFSSKPQALKLAVTLESLNPNIKTDCVKQSLQRNRYRRVTLFMNALLRNIFCNMPLTSTWIEMTKAPFRFKDHTAKRQDCMTRVSTRRVAVQSSKLGFTEASPPLRKFAHVSRLKHMPSFGRSRLTSGSEFN